MSVNLYMLSCLLVTVTMIGMFRYWQPGALWVEGEANISVSHNEVTNVPYYGIRQGAG